MALIQWSNDLSVKVGQIDAQHQRLIGMINELNDAMRQGKGKEAVAKIVDGLIAYTKTHFALEEKYFAQHKYPDTEGHVRQHRDFEKKVVDFKNDLANGKLTLSMQVMNFLSDWLRNHIMGTDQKYVAFFQEHGMH